MALIGGCTMAVVYVPYVVIRVDMHAPITGGYLSSVLPVAWAAAALASASVSAWAHRFIVSGPILVTFGLILTGWALTTGSLVADCDRRSLWSVRVSGWHGRISEAC